MNEKAYKTMGLTGAANIAIGIVVMVVGVAAGVVAADRMQISENDVADILKLAGEEIKDDEE